MLRVLFIGLILIWRNTANENLMNLTVVDNQSPQIGYPGRKLMYQRDFFRIELQISKDVEKSISEVFPTSD
jgi:hypothetical protein